MNKAILAASLVLALASGSAMASDVSSPSNYTFVEGGYAHVNPENTSIDAKGAFVKGSYEFNQSGAYVFGKASRVDVERSTVDINEYEAGVGYHRAFSNRVDGFGELAGVRLNADGGFRATGYRAGLGVRVGLTDKLEGKVQANYRDGDDFYGNTTGVVGLKYGFNERLAVLGDVEFGHDAETYNVGLRYSF